MTQPGSHGYPDYGRYTALNDKLYLNDVFPANPGADTYGPFFVGDVSSLLLRIQTESARLRVQLDFFNASSFSNGYAQHGLDYGPAQVSSVVLPVLGSWVKVIVTADIALANYLIILASTSANRSPIGADPETNILLAQLSTPVGAGATVTTNVPQTRPGPALLNIDTSLATWLATVSSVDFLSSTTRIHTITHLSDKTQHPLELPAAPIRFTFQNTTGAAGAYTAAILGRHMWPGS